jgi:hypothetical protein
VCYGGGHAPIIRLVAERLILNDHHDFAILPLNGAINFFNDHLSSKVVKLSDFHFLFDSYIPDILKYGNMLFEENFNPNMGISKFESIFYLGLSFFDLVSENGYDLALEKYESKKRQSFLPINTMMKILECLQPDLIVTTNSPRFEYATILASKNLNIVSLQILDLFGDDFPIPSADHIVVMNEKIAYKLNLNSNNSSIFYPYGQPVLDFTFDKVKSYDFIEIKKENNLGLSKILLFSPTKNFIYNEDLSIKEVRDSTLINTTLFHLLSEVSDFLDIQIVIRVHPSDNINNYNVFFENSNRFHYLPHLNVYESIAISDFCLSYNSTLSLQALICNKISFTFNQNPGSKYFWKEFSEYPFIYSKDYIELKNNLISHISECANINLNDFFERGSLNKIVNLIDSIIEE